MHADVQGPASFLSQPGPHISLSSAVTRRGSISLRRNVGKWAYRPDETYRLTLHLLNSQLSAFMLELNTLALRHGFEHGRRARLIFEHRCSLRVKCDGDH